jgi:hypothetical protein
MMEMKGFARDLRNQIRMATLARVWFSENRFSNEHHARSNVKFDITILSIMRDCFDISLHILN